MADPKAAQAQLQSLSDDFQKIQTDLQSAVTARQRLEAQQQENLSVQNEFKKLDETSNIYKLIGPVLLKQDKTEATSAVDGRLEFIASEIKRIEGQIKSLQSKGDEKKMEIYQIQTQMQQTQGSEQAQVGA